MATRTPDITCMEVTAASATAITNAQMGNEISILVAKKAMDASKAEGDAAISLLQSAANVQQSQERSHATGPGGSLDVVA